MLDAVFTERHLAEVPIATVPLPTIVWPVFATNVTAPEAEPVFICDQSKELLVTKVVKLPACIAVPVGNVNDTAVAELVVMISVSKFACVKVAVAFCALGVGCVCWMVPVIAAIPVKVIFAVFAV